MSIEELTLRAIMNLPEKAVLPVAVIGWAIVFRLVLHRATRRKDD